MLPTIPPAEGVLLSEQDIRVSTTLNQAILAEDLEDVVVASRTVSAVGFQESVRRAVPRHVVVARTGAVATVRAG